MLCVAAKCIEIWLYLVLLFYINNNCLIIRAISVHFGWGSSKVSSCANVFQMNQFADTDKFGEHYDVIFFLTIPPQY